MNKLVAIVVTHNRLNKLKIAIEKLLEQEVFRIVVIDNASTDGTREWLRQLYHEQVFCVFNSENIGGAGGFNLGLTLALEQFEPDWILLQDDDAYPAPGAIKRFLQSDLREVDAVAAAVFYPNGHICEMNRPSRNPFWYSRFFLKTIFKGREGFHLNDKAYSSTSPIPIDAGSFVGFFVRSEIVKQLKNPDPKLFLYGEDVIYTLELSRKGFRFFFFPWVKYVHDCSTFVNNKRVYNPIWKVYYTYRNGLIMYRVAAGMFFWVVLPYKLVLWIIRGRMYDDRKIYYKLLWLAIFDGVFKKELPSHEEIVSTMSCTHSNKS